MYQEIVSHAAAVTWSAVGHGEMFEHTHVMPRGRASTADNLEQLWLESGAIPRASVTSTLVYMHMQSPESLDPVGTVIDLSSRSNAISQIYFTPVLR